MQCTRKLKQQCPARSPLGGYQYVSVESVEPDNDISLEGFTSCPAFVDANNEFYASDGFKQVAAENADFLTALSPLLDGRNTSLVNAYNVYDYMNVNNIHNATVS